jgi:hypothetical protein
MLRATRARITGPPIPYLEEKADHMKINTTSAIAVLYSSAVIFPIFSDSRLTAAETSSLVMVAFYGSTNRNTELKFHGFYERMRSRRGLMGSDRSRGDWNRNCAIKTAT